MREIPVFKDTRLIEALDYIDRDLIAEVIDDIKAPTADNMPAQDKKTVWKSVKYTLLLAACVMLLGTVIPAVTYVATHLDIISAGLSGQSASIELTDENTEEDVNSELETEAEFSPEIPKEHLENAPYPIFTPDLEPLSEEKIAEIKSDWYNYVYDAEYKEYRKKNTSKTEKEITSAITPLVKGYTQYLFSGKQEDTFYARYYGTVNSCVILSMVSRLEGAYNVITVGGTSIENDYSFYIFVQCEGKIETLENAFQLGWLDESNIEQIKARHEQYVSYGSWIDDTVPVYGYAKFVPELEDIPESTLKEITEAIFEQKYEEYLEMCEKEGANLKIRKEKEAAVTAAYRNAELERAVFILNAKGFDEAHDEKYRYFGTFGDSIVWATVGQLNPVNQYHIGDFLYTFLPGASLNVYNNGKILKLSTACKQGIISAEEHALIYRRYRAYNDYLENPERNAVQTQPLSKALAYSWKVTVEELYDDVKKGGWVVTSSGYVEFGIELWNEFLEKTAKGEAASVLIANYFPAEGESKAQIFLKDITFDGSTYTVINRTGNKIIFTETEYKYIIKCDIESAYIFVPYDQNNSANWHLTLPENQSNWLVKIPK